MQPVRNLVRLWRKPAMAPAAASFVFGAAPVVSLVAACAAGLLTPSFTLGMATAPAADLVVIAGLLGVSRGVVGLAAYDAGSAPAAYAGGRVMAAGLGTAPVLLLVALAATLAAGGTNLDAAAAALRDGGLAQRGAGVVAGVALWVLAVQEPKAPAAWSGWALALLLAAEQMRRVVAFSLAATLLPWGMAAAGAGLGAWSAGVAAWGMKLAVLGAFAALAQRPRSLLPAAALLALIACVVLGVQGAE